MVVGRHVGDPGWGVASSEVAFACACSASADPAATFEDGVCCGVLVLLWAVGSAGAVCRDRVPAEGVGSAGDDFEVAGIDAVAGAAEVVDLHAVGDGVACPFVGHAVGSLVFAESELSVALVAYECGPVPALVGVVDLDLAGESQ